MLWRALNAIATIAAKHDEAGIETAAANFGVNVVLVPGALRSRPQATVVQTRSERVLALTGVPSVAEAAALAAAADGAPDRPRIAVGAATCALPAEPIGIRAVTVHFIGAGPGAADLITCAGAI